MAGPGRSPSAPVPTQLGELAVEALSAMGFSQTDARRAVALELADGDSAAADPSGRTMESVVKGSLKRLAPSRKERSG